MSRFTSHHTLPPFPEHIETAPLVSVSLDKLQAGEAAAADAFFSAGKELGFMYLDMNGSELGETIVQEAEALNAVQKEWFALPTEVKDAFWQKKPGNDGFYAYRYASRGEDRNESYNIRKAEILGQKPGPAYHPIITSNLDLLKSYALHCRQVVELMLDILETKLALPTGTLRDVHRADCLSGDHVRFIRSPVQAYDELNAKNGEHTDFGSITILFNWLGGLQIRTPDEREEWVYVRPVPGSCVVNFGDALVKFTAGILRSNIHRVIPPAGEQAKLERNSLVFFSRPEDDVYLKRLSGGLIDAQPQVDEGTPVTSDEWIRRRTAGGDLSGVYTLKKGFELHSLLPQRIAAH